MSSYYIKPSNDVKQINGSAITATSTRVVGGTAYGLHETPASGLITAQVDLGDLGDGENPGSRVIRGADVFSAYGSAPVALTSVANNGSGKCRFTKASHGYVVGDYINITGSTTGNLDGTHKVTNVPTSGTFDTNVAYVASADPGDAVKSAGRFADQGVDTYFYPGASVNVGVSGNNTDKYGDDSAKQPILKYRKRNFGTDSAANPTRAIPGEFGFRSSGNPSTGVVQDDYPAGHY